MTSVIVFIMIGYGLIKFNHLLTKHNPLISEVNEKFFYDWQEQLDLKDIGFRFAWTFEGYLDKERKDDPRYVKQIVRILRREAGKESEIFLPYRRCTAEDFSEFALPARGHEDQI